MLGEKTSRNVSLNERAIAFELIVPAIKYFICASTPELRAINNTLNLIIAVIFVSLFILSLLKSSTIKVKKTILIISVAIVVYLFNYFFYSNARENLSESAFRFFGISILILVLTVNLNKVDALFNLLRNGSYLIVFSELIFLFFKIRYSYNTFSGESYSLSLSNYLILPICILLYDFLSNRNILSLIGTIISLGVGGIYGSRSFILSIVIFGLLYIVYIKNRGKLTRSLMSLVVIAIPVSIIILNESDNIKKILLKIYYALGINSRSLHMMLTKTFYVSGRDKIISETILPAIKEHPLMGSGLLGITGAHNILLEALVSHGIIAGTLIIIALFAIFAKKMRCMSTEDIKSQVIFMTMYSYAFVDSMTHLTVIGKDYFWVALGLCFVYIPRLEHETNTGAERERENMLSIKEN